MRYRVSIRYSIVADDKKSAFSKLARFQSDIIYYRTQEILAGRGEPEVREIDVEIEEYKR